MYSAGFSLAAELLLRTHVQEVAATSLTAWSSTHQPTPADASAAGSPQGHASAHWTLEGIAWDARAMRAEEVPFTTAAAPAARCTLLPAPLAAPLAAAPPPDAEVRRILSGAKCATDGGLGDAALGVLPRPAGRDAPSCRVPGCDAPLRARGACARSRLCGAHLRAPAFSLQQGAQEMCRWCQKCNRTHELDAFAGTQRTCVVALAAANARRRARVAASAAGGNVNASSARSSAGEDGGGAGSALEALAATSPFVSPADTDDADEFQAALARAFGAHAALQPRFGGPACESGRAEAAAVHRVPPQQLLFDDPPALFDDEFGTFASLLFAPDAAALLPPAPPPALVGMDSAVTTRFAAAPPPLDALAAYGYQPYAAPSARGWWPARAHVKIAGDDAACAPTGLPRALAPAVSAALFLATPAGLTAAVAPGCTLLTFEALVPTERQDQRGGSGAGAVGDGAAEATAALAALLAAPDGVGAYFRGRECVQVAARGRVATARYGRVTGDAPAPPGPRLPPLAALAARCDAPARVRPFAPGAAVPPATALRCRVHGRFLRLSDVAPDERDGGGIALAPAGEEGVALLEMAPDSGSGSSAFAALGAPRPLLLTRHDDVIAELNGSVAALRRLDSDAAEADVTLLGHSLRPGAPPRLLAAAAAAAMRRGWPATAARCCAALGALLDASSSEQSSSAAAAPGLGWWQDVRRAGVADDAGDDVTAPRRLLHVAVAAGCARSVAAVLAAGGPARRLGAACARGDWPGSATPLHLAVELAAGGLPAASDAACAVLALLTSHENPAGADACVAWLWVRDDAGRTPTDLVAAAGAAAPPPLLALDASLRAAVYDARPAARLATALARSKHGVFHLPHAAELAADELASAALEGGGGAEATRRAALGAALLRAATTDWLAREACSDTDATTASAPLVDTAAAFAAREKEWRLQQYMPGLELMAAFQTAYHFVQWRRCGPSDVPLAAVGASALATLGPPRAPGIHQLESFEQLAPLFSFAFRTNLWFQAPVTAALVVLLVGGARCRALLARHLQPMLAVQYAVHAIVCMIVQMAYFHALVMQPAGVRQLHLPTRCAAYGVTFTFLCAASWPQSPAWALPLLAVRAACPLLVALQPERLAWLWPANGGAPGAAMQAGAAVLAAVHCVLRERRLRQALLQHEAAAAALSAGAAYGAAGKAKSD